MIAWANAESVFIALLERLLDSSSLNARAVHAGIVSNRGRMELLRTLIPLNLDEEDQKTAMNLVERFKAPSSLRNELAHSVYVFGEDFKYTAIDVMTGQGIRKPTRKPFTKARLNEIRNSFDRTVELNQDVWRFCHYLDQKRGQAPQEATPERPSG